jgi:uncharacterized membrane protein
MIKTFIHYIFYKLNKSAEWIESKIVKLKGGSISAVLSFICLLLTLPVLKTIEILNNWGINVYLFTAVMIIILAAFLLFFERYFKKRVFFIKQQFKDESRAKSVSGALLLNFGIIIYLYLVFRYVRK